MQDSEAKENPYRDLSTPEQRKKWYSPVADAYNKARPRYPEKIITRAVELANLPPDAKILELGCGPGTATTAFADRGFTMVCIEPSLAACELARHNCVNYPQVEIINTTFEEWPIETEKFNAVVAATSFHWMSPEMRCFKSAQALKQDGSLILLWNIPLQPQEEVCQILRAVYQNQAVSVSPYESRENHEKDLVNICQTITDSGLFTNLISESFGYELTYTIDDYLALLSTFSVYIALETQQRHALFTALKTALDREWGKSFQISCLATLHIANKII